jgi:uncharacterized protein YyaL (SSP411 family)
VDWYPWGEEALKKAVDEDRPIFLSIGYAACHWCHVMERECFEDPEIAALMNELFVNVKVDREERPDIDEIYMTSVQLLHGQGGWPLSVWLTPERLPYFGGTYFPPQGRWGMPGFPDICRRMADLYRKDPEDLAQRAGKLTRLVAANSGLHEGQAAPEQELLDGWYRKTTGRFDPEYGGFGSAPKFPPSFALELLLRRRDTNPENRARCDEMLSTTLDGMARGGMYDQLGGGFHRYSTDARWLVPHFEKMLYDNALLVPVYLSAGERLARPQDLRVARECLEWCRREMLDEGGAFWSTQDADTEGVEGKYFVWTPEQLDAACADPEDARVLKAYFEVSSKGNWHEMPGCTVLARWRTVDHVAKVLSMDADQVGERLVRGAAALLTARGARTRPGTDDKVLTAWNGLMIRAYARGARALGEPAYLEVARAAARFCLGTLRTDAGLLRTYRAGKAHLNAYQEDYAFLVQGLCELFEATLELEWLEAARELADEMLARFWDDEEGGFFFTSHDHEALIARTKNPTDNATPSGNSAAAQALLHLGQLTDDPRYTEHASATLAAFAPGMQKVGPAFQNMLAALDTSLRAPVELVIVGPPGDEVVEAMAAWGRRQLPLDARILVVDPARADRAELDAAVPLVAGKTAAQDVPTAYLCRGGTCAAPATDLEALEAQLS